MSKLTKLINNPTLFFSDSIKKRKQQLINKSQKILNVSITENKTSVKPSVKPSLLINTEINLFSKYFILHTGEKQFSLSHVKIWYEYFCQSGFSFIIVTRYGEAYDDILSEYPEATIVLAKNKEDIDVLFESVASIDACFYMSNTGNNSHLLYHVDTKHIFIGHGDSDKSASAHKYFRAYDENWTAGQAHIDRFKNAGFKLNGLKQIKVGRPTLIDAIKSSEVYWKDRFDGCYRLLYLPTWEGAYKEQDYSSLSIVTNVLAEISNITNISTSIKLHPFTGRRDLQFNNLEKDISDLEHEGKLGAANSTTVISKADSLLHHIQSSNIFICDISAAVSECLAANAPIFLYIPRGKDFNLSKSNMPYSEYCYVFSSVPQLLELIVTVILDGNDFLFNKRKIAAEYIISVEETMNNSFVKKIQELGVNNA